ncbi:transposon Tf2-11 polyprotein [Trichonephila clavipes]|nr:transposon Tf2-11 polyprotein [Trichonephila clavipes]
MAFKYKVTFLSSGNMGLEKIQSFNLKIDYTPGKANVVAEMLSRPSYTEGAASDVCAITVDMPSRKSSDIRKGQLEDEELKKIIDCFESMDKDEKTLPTTPVVDT